MLIVWGTKDETVIPGAANDGNCGDRLGDRPNSRFVPIKDGAHNVIPYAEAKEAIKEFLAEQTK